MSTAPQVPRGESVEEVRAKLTQEWDVRGIDVATLKVDRSGTIAPKVRGTTKADATAAEALDAGVTYLPELVLDGDTDTVREVELGETIGEGGMGIVWAAVQTPLRREVAVKSVHPRSEDPEDIAALLREARITGTLEHPNVVPIHALGRDAVKRPLIIMKRIEGTTWAALLEKQRAQGPGAVMSQLEYHIGVLIDVAKAVHFAHSRGIIHRDIKPENVMIGGFGEVYVVDWGVAVSTREGNDLNVPLARHVVDITGSPAYMAPEMAVGDGAHIDERTDVYLLGAMLHEILTGDPPHAAANTVAMLTSAYASAPPQYDSTIPSNLAEICQTAMSREADARYQSASGFAAALQRYLKHRDSTLLADEAAAKLDALRDAVAVAGNEPDRPTLYNLFNECRFGFLHALRIWEGNTRAREELQGALELMIGFELDHGSAAAAETLLAELPIHQPNLARRVERKRSSEHHHEVELKELKRKYDPTVIDRPRAYLAFSIAVTWPLLHGLLYYVDSLTRYAVGHLELGAGYGLFAVAALAIAVAGRETLLTRDRSGLQTQLTITLCHVALAALWPVCAALEMEVPDSYTVMFFLAAAMWTTGAIAVDRRMLTWGLSMLVGLVATLLWPTHAII